MRKGLGHDDQQQVEFGLAQLFGAIRQQIIFFSAENGISAERVAQRMAESLDPLGQRGVQGQVQYLRGSTGSEDRHALATMEVAIGSLGDGQTSRRSAEVQSHQRQDREEAVKPSSKQAEFWAKFSPEEKAAEMAHRLSKRKNLTDIQKKQLKSLRAKAKGVDPRKPKTDRKQLDKQRVYQARYEARKKGLPEPALPRR